MAEKDIVIDTNIFVGALQRGDGVNRKILEMAFRDDIRPMMGDALYHEYESLLYRDELYSNSLFTRAEREAFFDDFCFICRWVSIQYRWRPNLRDEGDNHVIELALAAGAPTLVTWNVRDFKGGDLLLPDLSILTPVQMLEQLRVIKKT